MGFSKFLRFVWLISLGVSIGCGGQGLQVSGRVTLDGEPLNNGRIALRPAAHLASSRPVSTEIDKGRFAFDQSHQISAGSYVVVISAWRKTGNELKVDEAEPLEEYEQYLPTQFNEQSKLSADIRGNTSNLLFELELPADVTDPTQNEVSGEETATENQDLEEQ